MTAAPETSTGELISTNPRTGAEVARFAADTVQVQLESKSLVLHRNLPADLPPVRADVEKTTWVLINLLANAIRYSPVGEAITIRAERQGKFVRLGVQDKGPGIAPEHHERNEVGAVCMEAGQLRLRAIYEICTNDTGIQQGPKID